MLERLTDPAHAPPPPRPMSAPRAPAPSHATPPDQPPTPQGLIERLRNLKRALGYARKHNLPAVWTELGHSFLAAGNVQDAVDAYLRGTDFSSYVEVSRVALHILFWGALRVEEGKCPSPSRPACTAGTPAATRRRAGCGVELKKRWPQRAG